MDWFTAPQNFLFTIAFTIMICFAVLEAVSMLFGGGMSQWLSDLTPDVDGSIDLPDTPHGPGELDVQKPGFTAQFLSWLECGRLPFLISFNAFLGAFSVIGFTLQGLCQVLQRPYLSTPVAAGASLFLALPILKYMNRWLGRVWPDDETSAFAPEEFIGRTGVVTIGKATPERAAEVRLIGPDQRTHYLMVLTKDGVVSQGEEILIIERLPDQTLYRGIPASQPLLSL
jgi:hypothetical protein